MVVRGEQVRRLRRHEAADVRRHDLASKVVALIFEHNEARARHYGAEEERCCHGAPRVATAPCADIQSPSDAAAKIVRRHILAQVRAKRGTERATGFKRDIECGFARDALLETRSLDRVELST
ncbi:MAG: hypothetical protein WA884_13335 [Methyloceanibacter sp.]